MIVPTSLFRNCVVGTLSVGTLTLVVIMQNSINEKKGKAVAHNQHKWLDLVAVLVWC